MRLPNRPFTALVLILAFSAAGSHARSESDAGLAKAIIGAWSTPGGPCDSDLTEAFSPGGIYGTDYSDGKWAIKNHVLTRTIEYTGELGEERQKMEKPDTWSVIIIRIAKTYRIEQSKDKSIEISTRCQH